MRARLKWLLIPFFALLNLIRGGWWFGKHWTVKPWWKKSDIIWGLGHLVLVPWLGWIAGPLAALGAFFGGLAGWGPYIGAVIDGKYENGTPNPKIAWIDALCRPLVKWPILWGMAALTLRGLMWSASVALMLLIAVYFCAGWGILYGALGYGLMPLAFLCARLAPSSYRWQAGEVILGAFVGLGWALTL